MAKHVESLPDLYTPKERSLIKKHLTFASFSEKEGIKGQSLETLLPELATLDLSDNKIPEEELLSNMGSANQWVVELDTRGNDFSQNAHVEVQKRNPFLEIYNGEVITEIGYGTKCKIKKLGGEWSRHEDADDKTGAEFEMEEEEELREYFDAFEGQVEDTRTRFKSTFDYFAQKVNAVEESQLGNAINLKVEESKKRFDNFMQTNKENLSTNKSDNKQKKQNPKNDKKKKPKSSNETKKSRLKRFRFLRMGQKMFAPGGCKMLKQQNDMLRLMLNK